MRGPPDGARGDPPGGALHLSAVADLASSPPSGVVFLPCGLFSVAPELRKIRSGSERPRDSQFWGGGVTGTLGTIMKTNPVLFPLSE